MRIGVDFDDVLFDTYASLITFHNARYGTAHKRDDVRDWLLERLWNCTPEESLRRIHEWYASDDHLLITPVPGAQEAIAEIAKKHELHVITARADSTKEKTEILLEKYFPKLFAGLHFGNHFSGARTPKADIMRGLDISLHIDDSPAHAGEVAAAGNAVLLLDTPWNQGFAASNITRFHSWGDILSYIRSL